MRIVKRLVTVRDMFDFFNGKTKKTGTLGSNSAASPDFQDLTPNAFAGVEVGDRVYISGENPATVFLVATVTNVNNIILNVNVVNAHMGNAIWRVHEPDGVAPTSVEFQEHSEPGVIVVYNATSFGAS